jgi:thiol:disulfide interchange protein DsbA
MKKLLVFLVLMASTTFLHAEEYKEGVHYKKLSQAVTTTSDKIEVLEFFWYGCPHCYSFEPYVKSWKKALPENVTFARVPAIFRPDWEIQARTYYALSNMGLIETVHGKIFEEVHKNKKRLNTLESMTAFIEKNGVDRKKFLEEYKSFGVDGLVRKAKKKQSEYKIQGVPGVVVNGKYLASGSMAGSYDNMVKIIDHLIALESKAAN